ncbi:hypothetical protein E6H25_05765 [Candidatus Bathyarchaeota archaeon]|nr:MAG: hypothetical protein E6H25_05765 [Candidatus Bathyarchaeota archaeon]
MDDDTTILKLKKQVTEFRDARDWLRYDTPRSLAISISVEGIDISEAVELKLKKNGERYPIAGPKLTA